MEKKAKSSKKLTLKNEKLYYEFFNAIKYKDLNEAKALVDNPNYNLKNLDLSTKNCSRLITTVAIENEDIQALDFLLDNGASVHATCPHIGWTLLMFSVSQGSLKMTQHLIKRGININATTEKDDLNVMSVALGKKEIMDLLISEGINLQHKPKGQRSFLQSFVYGDKNWDDMYYLISKGATTEGLYMNFTRYIEPFKVFIEKAQAEYEKNKLENSISSVSLNSKSFKI